ncbi:MAG: hypothetical protein LBR20_06570 [Propionibacteriaceae bacterium]|jgi:hypothetical protein|nr:hypothetical protein [Propionibacteriaceae bacterium]
MGKLKGAAALLGLVAIVVALPMLLVATATLGLPHLSWESLWSVLTRTDDGTLFFTLLKVAGWIVWALLLISITAEVVGRLRHRRIRHIRFLGWSQSLAHGLVASVALLFASTATVNTQTVQPAQAAPVTLTQTPKIVPLKTTPTVGQTTQHAQPQHDTPQQATPAKPTPEKPARQATHTRTVQKGDTLSQIALEELGDAERYPEIFKLSKGKPQHTGHRITDPDMIWPGDKVTIPGHTPATPAETPEEETTPEETTLEEPAEPDTTSNDTDTVPVEAGRTVTDEELQNPTATPSIAADADDTVRAAPSDRGAQVAAPMFTTEDTLPTPTETTLAPQEAAPEISAEASVPVVAGTDAEFPTSPTPHGQQTPAGQQMPTGEEVPELAEVGAPTWLLAGLTGAGVLLAGGIVLMFAAGKRNKLRYRRPGKHIQTVTAQQHIPVEATIRRAGEIGQQTLTGIHKALANLSREPQPELLWIDADPETALVTFAGNANLPAPWTPTSEPNVWQADFADLPDTPTAYDPVAWPQLVDVGQQGDIWRLINLEALGTVTLTGEKTYREDLARYLVSQLALTPWGGDITVDLANIFPETGPLSPERIRHHTQVPHQIVEHARHTAETLDGANLTVSQARAAQYGDDLHTSRILVTSSRNPAVDQLDQLINDEALCTGTSILLTDSTPAGVEIQVGADGTVHIPQIRWHGIANRLSAAEADACAQYVAGLAETTDTDMPIYEHPATPWQQLADQSGQLRAEYTKDRDSHIAQALESETLTTATSEQLVETTPNLPEDLPAVAPAVPVTVRNRIKAADPTLKEDLEAFAATYSDRPRLSVLGQMKVRVGRTGNPAIVAKRRQFYTELVAYLAAQPEGATTVEIADVFGLEDERVRKDMSVLRTWLGNSPDGKPYLPYTKENPLSAQRGESVYSIPVLLSDADLFRRLRLRAHSKGEKGAADLEAALSLVEGPPYQGFREGHGHWLAAQPDDTILTEAIIDVAHQLATHHLAKNQIDQAREATQIALIAAPDNAAVLTDLAAIMQAEGNSHASRTIRDQIENWAPDGGAPYDTPTRLERIFQAHLFTDQPLAKTA